MGTTLSLIVLLIIETKMSIITPAHWTDILCKAVLLTNNTTGKREENWVV